MKCPLEAIYGIKSPSINRTIDQNYGEKLSSGEYPINAGPFTPLLAACARGKQMADKGIG
ncbi:MAG: hypothetical protein HN377_01960 [Alphaproteobacteria bacterium]|jgi:hypothetical protein|nr:hypothetical protein [Alphaproteobacteria bacterium]MBT7942897.1 hypothetical protein [Alphaproteobacteria bacterium]